MTGLEEGLAPTARFINLVSSLLKQPEGEH